MAHLLHHKIVQYIEIDVDYCSLTYSVPPCMATLVNSPPTGTIKCFNTLDTCQDRANFTNVPVTLRYAVPTDYLSQDIECIPNIKSIAFDPAIISLGKDLGQRATLTITFTDHRHSDTGQGYDKYLADRPYDPYQQGTYWGKFAARQPFVRGRALRWITGNSEQSLAEMETRHYIIDSFSGPTNNGDFKIIAKDMLKLADGDRALAPAISEGYLVADITNSQTTLTLSPSSIGLTYPTDGYVAIGGTEVCHFYRLSYVVLLLNFNVADATTTFTDESGTLASVGVAGNAQADTAQFKFGTASLLLDGTTDYIYGDSSSNYAFGTGDFTIELWVRLNGNQNQRFFYDFRNTVDGAFPVLFLDAAQKLVYFVNTATQIQGTTVLTANVWHHLVICRSGTSTKLFLDGTQEGSTYSDSTNYTIAGTQRPIFGAKLDTTFALAGWMDNIRIVKGQAIYTANFTAPTAPVGLIDGPGDVMRILRAQKNTTASAHSAQDRVQLCTVYEGISPDIIIADLLQTYAAVDSIYIPAADWANEISSYLNRVYTATIAQPTAVNTLISELIEQAGLSMWWDDREQHVNMLVLRGLVYDTETAFSEDNMMADTLEIKEQPDKRLSQVHTYFGQINPLTSLTDKANYRSVSKIIDTQAEADYGSAAIKEIFSRWIAALGRSVADRLGNILLGRFVDPPRNVRFSMLRGSTAEIQLGRGYQFNAWPVQDATGAQQVIPIQITRLRPSPDLIEVEADESLTAAAPEDLTIRNIIIDANIYNVNLRDAHDDIYPTPQAGITVICTINSGVKVGSTLYTQNSLVIGDWPAGVTIIVNIVGRVQGKGGAGYGLNNPNANGGPALYTRYAINLALTGGQLWGGGGGGAYAYFVDGDSNIYIWGGGAGAGFDIGIGGTGNANGGNGANSTTEAGGAGSGYAGAGGGPGINGSPPSISGGGQGTAGSAIDGVSYVTFGSWNGTTFTPGSHGGDIRGPMVN